MISRPTCNPPLMMPAESDVRWISLLSPSPQSQSSRAVIRKLLEKYTKEEIHRLIEEESSSISASYPEPPKLTPPGSYSGFGSDNVPALISSSDHINALAPDIFHVGSQLQRYASNPSRLPPNTIPPRKSQGRNSSASGTVLLSPTQGLDFTCGFCAEESIKKTCTRRYDLRRHIERFHNSNALWFCQHPGCRLAYDWQAACQNHLLNAHGQSHMDMDERIVKLCPQVVFACGFEKCSHIFEAASQDETVEAFQEYSRHIVKHFKKGSNGGRWTYSTRIHNLLRQSLVWPTWDKSWPEPARAGLQWDTQSSMALRKLLEARHLDNLPLLIQRSIMLGSSPAEARRFVGRLELPVKTRCPYEHNASQNARRLSPHVDDEQDRYQFQLSPGISLDYGFIGAIQLGEHVPQSVELFNALQLAEYGWGRYDDPKTMHL